MRGLVSKAGRRNTSVPDNGSPRIVVMEHTARLLRHYNAVERERVPHGPGHNDLESQLAEIDLDMRT